MPFINLKTNVSIDETNALALKTSFGDLISTLKGKSETWLMVNVEQDQKMFFRGSDEPCAYLEVKVYGNSLNEDEANKLTSRLTETLHKTLRINSDRIYVAYFLTSTWGFAGENF